MKMRVTVKVEMFEDVKYPPFMTLERVRQRTLRGFQGSYAREANVLVNQVWKPVQDALVGTYGQSREGEEVEQG